MSVPGRYRGVWSRSLLQTPTLRDEKTFVRWLQASHWHADLRVPVGARRAAADGADDAGEAARLALQQGFCGVTEVAVNHGEEVCAWHRRVDFQPPGPQPDAGRIVFEGPDRLVETGVHADYLEVWERLPGSSGRFAVIESGAMRWLIAGRWAMRVRPRVPGWPGDTSTADTLADLLRRHPEEARRLLDFEISFGHLQGGRFEIVQSTLPALEGRAEACLVRRASDDVATLAGPTGETTWRVVEWDVDGATLG